MKLEAEPKLSRSGIEIISFNIDKVNYTKLDGIFMIKFGNYNHDPQYLNELFATDKPDSELRSYLEGVLDSEYYVLRLPGESYADQIDAADRYGRAQIAMW